jgi:MerR family redox-sensitive transcriptional activator SoxR
MVTAPDSAEPAMLSIGDVARAAGIMPSKIRYYERKGLLPTPQRSGGKRRYDASILQLLRVIEVSKDAGFSLKEIEHLLHGFGNSTRPSERWRALAEDKLREVDDLIVRAEGMRALLKRGLECGCLTLDDCQLLG